MLYFVIFHPSPPLAPRAHFVYYAGQPGSREILLPIGCWGEDSDRIRTGMPLPKAGIPVHLFAALKYRPAWLLRTALYIYRDVQPLLLSFLVRIRYATPLTNTAISIADAHLVKV